MKRIIITGGAGFIGSNLIKELLKDSNNEIFIIDNLTFGQRSSLIEHKNCTLFQDDIRDYARINLIFENINPVEVIHLAAIHYIPYCNAHPVEASEVNILGTKNVLEACKHVRPEKVFCASTAAVYPIADKAMTEEDTADPVDIYGITKLANEESAKLFSLTSGIPTVIGRFFNAYGPNETNPHIIPVILNQIKDGDVKLKLGNIFPKRDYIHTTDMAHAIIGLMAEIKTGCEIYNIGTGVEYSVEEIVKIVEEKISRKIQVEIDQSRVRKVERNHLCADISKIKKTINWSPKINFEEGLSDLIYENTIC